MAWTYYTAMPLSGSAGHTISRCREKGTSSSETSVCSAKVDGGRMALQVRDGHASAMLYPLVFMHRSHLLDSRPMPSAPLTDPCDSRVCRATREALGGKSSSTSTWCSTPTTRTHRPYADQVCASLSAQRAACEACLRQRSAILCSRRQAPAQCAE